VAIQAGPDELTAPDAAVALGVPYHTVAKADADRFPHAVR
jgi:hypothetical protein